MGKKTAEQIRYNMQRVKNKDSKIELCLRHELWHRGMRYRKNVTNVIGKPDIVFLRQKIAVFCDSEFWHGYDWVHRKEEIKSNRDFWIKKIEANMKRDTLVTEELEKTGWLVLRFWGQDILKNTTLCADRIEMAIKERTAGGKAIPND